MSSWKIWRFASWPLLVLVALLPAAHSAALRFMPDDPLWVDPDRLSIPEPRRVELSKGYDLLENSFFKPGGGSTSKAVNINTLGEVPDSSWFTNRMGVEALSIETLVRGPNRIDGPDRSQPWSVLSVKSEGITPGLTIRDGSGDRYLLKFDPQEHPQMTTSAEVIGTKFFHAFGYNVPENYLVFFARKDLRPAADSKFTDDSGSARSLTGKDLDQALRDLPKRADGTIQAVASRYVPGKPIGQFKYYGTRSDDSNDIFPHEDRRELRGTRVFFSWLNHNDSDATNTLDSYVEEGSRRFIRHYLIDFGTTLGSGAFEPKALRAGNEYYLECWPILRSAITFGFWDRPWRTLDYPEYPSIGRFESEYFNPGDWKADYPNPAHDRMQPADAFWATRIVARFSDDIIRALVRTGRLEDKDAEDYLVKTLIARRNKVVGYYLAQSNPIHEFQVDSQGGMLRFRNLGVDAGVGSANAYHFQWFRYNNQTGQSEPLGQIYTTTSSAIPLPADRAEFLRVQIHTIAPERPEWKKPVDVYLRTGVERKIVGIER
jgi:hypothetical protein